MKRGIKERREKGGTALPFLPHSPLSLILLIPRFDADLRLYLQHFFVEDTNPPRFIRPPQTDPTLFVSSLNKVNVCKYKQT